MDRIGRIVTIGLAPAWDISCRGRGLDWGRHAEIDERIARPAGKALNVSSALAWMGCPSIATGLWGRQDYDLMRRSIRSQSPLVRVEMTRVDGRTRENMTVVDTQARREMHLRQANRLATRASLPRLASALRKTVRKNDLCVFSGAMPGDGLLEPAVGLVEICRSTPARIVLDTYGPALKHLVQAGWPWLIAPNVEEFRGLLGPQIKDTSSGLVASARTRLAQIPMVLISRGSKGAILVTKRGAWTGRTTTRGKVLETVGCGDYLLAGFLASYSRRQNARAALASALKSATARAYGLAETQTWSAANRQIEVDVRSI